MINVTVFCSPILILLFPYEITREKAGKNPFLPDPNQCFFV
ncbi:hypothetical protein B4096_2900 [Heyndrickxia coagulans]|nr:hypothetical protein B4100_2826 [Heyndrickxia coagulans]KYC91944.1 hypothetical protein B4096_2900 [Heyndrickxia coagulans]